MTAAARCRLLRETTGGEAGAVSVSRPVLLPEVRRVQRAARSCASSWSSHSAWGLYAKGKVRRSHGWTDCSSSPSSGVEQRVSSLARWRRGSRATGVRGAECSSGLMGLLGDWPWENSDNEWLLLTSGEAGWGVEGLALPSCGVVRPSDDL